MENLFNHLFLLVAFVVCMYLYMLFSSCVDSHLKTESLWPRAIRWRRVLFGGLEANHTNEIAELIQSDCEDMERLLVIKMGKDDEERDDLNARNEALPSKAAAAAAKAALAYKLNKR